MAKPSLQFLTLLALAFCSASALTPTPPPETPEIAGSSCGTDTPVTQVVAPLPANVTGRVAFYLAEYEPKTLRVIQEQGLGNVNEIHPLASIYKGILLEAVMRDVDAGKLSLTQKLTTTAANRSIENYPLGTNSLQFLATRAIHNSDNTAADILLLTYGPERLSQLTQQRSPCTSILLTTKAMWAAQAGLLSRVLGPDVTAGAAAYAALPFNQRLLAANELIQEAQKFEGPAVDLELDKWFKGPLYTPQVDLDLQYTSTAKAFTDLLVRTYSGANLNGSRKTYRDIMAQGCCQPKKPRLTTKFWAAKAGSGWRIMTLTGYVEMPNGRLFAYTYLNDLSETQYAEQIEKQIRPVLGWIEDQLIVLNRP